MRAYLGGYLHCLKFNSNKNIEHYSIRRQNMGSHKFLKRKALKIPHPPKTEEVGSNVFSVSDIQTRSQFLIKLYKPSWVPVNKSQRPAVVTYAAYPRPFIFLDFTLPYKGRSQWLLS